MGLIIKHLSPRYSAAELSVYRNLFGMVPSAIALWSARAWHEQGRPVRLRQWWLAIVRGLVAIHGGTTSLESGPNAGTKVVVQLPASADIQ